MMGATRSMFTGGVENVASLPALSAIVTGLERPAPSPETITGLSCDAWKTPDNASLAMNGKLTSVVFQPAPLAAGEPAPQFSAGGVALEGHGLVRDATARSHVAAERDARGVRGHGGILATLDVGFRIGLAHL